MRYIHITIKHLVLVAALGAAMIFGHRAEAQTVPFGPSDPSTEFDCGDFQWPEVQSPCPEVQIKQKHDHTPKKVYRANGWDTVVTCATRSLTLSCMPYLPAQFFNGQYTVDTIPYDPPDPTFALGTKMPVSTDDDFAASATTIPFSFFFFGLQKNAFVLGANGLLTFNTDAAGRYCPWKYTASLPWTDTKSGTPHSMDCDIEHMRDAIYGIYEDTHPIASYLSGDQGIYYGVQDEAPCRKIICSWNGIPTFPGVKNKNNRCTYQIVCYEGSNIIEVHVKRRGINSGWQGARGLIGIQNATGEPQTKGASGETTRSVLNGSHPAYYPEGANLLTDTLDSIAFRFTPQGNTNTMYHWYRIFDDGRDSVDLPSAMETMDDTNGYYWPMGQFLSTCPTLTTAVVNPTCVSRYVFHLRFRDAASTWYNLYDTITVGIDTSHELALRPLMGGHAQRQLDVCRGQNAQLVLEFPEIQDTSEVHWTLKRPTAGGDMLLADTLFKMGQMYDDEQNRLKCIPVVVRQDASAASLPADAIDTMTIYMTADFVSGCHAEVAFLVRWMPSFDTVNRYGICEGETFHWDLNGQDYTYTTNTEKVNIPTSTGCDSIVHLDLTVYGVSYTVDERRDCKPLTWLNGKTYSADNDATAAEDTVVMKNEWGCDSVVQLDFKIRPMTPLIDADREYFDYEHLEVVLTDVSTGGTARRWVFPNMPEKTDATVFYTIPYELDSARILLIELSDFGCQDTASITLPFKRDVIWLPNAFTPTASDNNRFGAKSRYLLKAQMYIYNRFGALVFSCDEVDCEWDGTDVHGNRCPKGAYVYVVRYTTEFDPHITRTVKGTVTLIE